SGTILQEALSAARMLQEDFGVPADVWSVTSYSALMREAQDADRWNRLHPVEEPRVSYLERCFEGCEGPFVAASDYMAIVAEQIRQWLPGRYVTLGTDGYGRSDGREALRAHFEVDRRHIAVAALKVLADEGTLDRGTVAKAIEQYRIDPEKPNPVTA
ncbi:MAG: pyruvate dehydrogenase (acetyl-transferring), homodimeric type, partial [Gammaproteobacteria bacterium]